MARVVIGSRLPNGLVLTHPDSGEQVTLGSRFSPVVGQNQQYIDKGYSTTEVDQEFWDTWKAAYSGYQPLKSGAIFEAKNETEALAKLKELRKEKTGFEPMSQETKDIKKAVA